MFWIRQSRGLKTSFLHASLIWLSCCVLSECSHHSSADLTFPQQLVLRWLGFRPIDNLKASQRPLSDGEMDSESVRTLPHFVAGAGYDRHPRISYDTQMMHRPEIDLAASYLRSTDTYLEWGSGGSTLNFAPMVKRAFSIEHDCEWFNYMRGQLRARRSNYSNLHSVCVGVRRGQNGWGTISSYEHGDYRTFKPYVDRVDSFGERTFDAIFVDGRARMACALKSLQYMTNDSVLFIHDFYTRNSQYGGVLQYFNEVGRVLAYPNTNRALGPIDEPQGLVVLRRKPSAPDALTPEEINAKYDSVDWRYPYPRPLNSVVGLWQFYFVNSVKPSLWRRARNPEALVGLVRLDMIRIGLLYFALRCYLLIAERWNQTRRLTSK